jgi:hypothetical protein
LPAYGLGEFLRGVGQVLFHLWRAGIVSNAGEKGNCDCGYGFLMLIEYGETYVHNTMHLVTGELLVSASPYRGKMPIQAWGKTGFGFSLPRLQRMGTVFSSMKSKDDMAGTGVQQVNVGAESN